MIFPKWTNSLPLVLGAIAALAGAGVAAGVTIYLTPKYTRAGYQPVQPVPFSHKIHAGQLGLDCRYCHNSVEKSWFANLPGASTCMNCHNQVLNDDPRLQIVRLPNDHTAGSLSNAPTPAACLADNDLALGRLVEAVSRSKFWPQTWRDK